jgi:hypothetical protein
MCRSQFKEEQLNKRVPRGLVTLAPSFSWVVATRQDFQPL